MLFLIMTGLQDETFIVATHRTGEVEVFSMNLITCVIPGKIVNLKVSGDHPVMETNELCWLRLLMMHPTYISEEMNEDPRK